jgi:acyl-coenzyme A synthetase/AMP-(fatty) acid ligase
MEVEPIYHKVPRQLQFVTDLPKTSTGKIMRRRLREMDGELKPK